MGYTVFGDQQRWRGTKHIIPGSFVTASLLVTNTTGTIYTVPTGNTLYLISAHVYVGAVATGAFTLYISYSSPLPTTNLLAGVIEANYPAIVSPYTPSVPIPIPSGNYIGIYSGAAGLSVRGEIVGWLE